MGEAKRRKLLDPNFGKDSNKRQIWFDQMKRNLPKNYKPDYGHICYRDYGENRTTIFTLMNGNYMIAPDPYGYMLMSTSESSCISILMTKEQKKELDQKQSLCFKLKLFLGQRYRAKSGEYVLPFQLIEIL